MVKLKKIKDKLLDKSLINYYLFVKSSPSSICAILFLYCSSLIVSEKNLEGNLVITYFLAGFILLNFLLYIALQDYIYMKITSSTIDMGIALGFLYAITYTISVGWIIGQLYILKKIATIVISYLTMKGLSSISRIIFKKESLGSGDARLTAMGAAWLDPKGITIAMAIAFVFAGVTSATLRMNGKLKPFQQIPFAPFIALGVWEVWLWGPNWWSCQWQHLLGL